MENNRQQIVDSINANTNILVTVSSNPTVDELSAALGLTILLNNLEKRATAVFSGKIPAAITFLEPDKTFENTADSLRDFIIALDKEKADHLRYKVDGDLVKIFITPYRTTLSQADLDFSQGDYNVELVVAVGVKDQDHLDKALAAHGKILHDATVVTITAGPDTSSLGSVDWHDGAASSLGEMMTSLADGLKTDASLLDEQISTALLTGIVSATDRFSNDRTSSRVMTMAAQLMGAGANQQLIAAKLAEAHEIGPGSVVGKNKAAKAAEKADHTPAKKQQSASELSIDRQDKNSRHNNDSALAATLAEDTADVVPGEKELEAQIAAPAGQSMADIEQALIDATGPTEELQAPVESVVTEEPAPQPAPTPEPVMQSEPEQPVSPPEQQFFDPTPVAPVEPILPELPPLPDLGLPQQELAPQQSPMIINDHGSFSDQPPGTTQPINSSNAGIPAGEASIDPFANVGALTPDAGVVPPEETPFESIPAPTMPLDSPQFGTVEGAAQLGEVQPQPDPFASPDLAPVSDIPALPPLPPLPPMPADGSFPPLPPPPMMPDLGQPAVSLSGAVSGDVFGDVAAPAPAVDPTPAPTEPGQYRIPGQG